MDEASKQEGLSSGRLGFALDGAGLEQSKQCGLSIPEEHAWQHQPRTGIFQSPAKTEPRGQTKVV